MINKIILKLLVMIPMLILYLIKKAKRNSFFLKRLKDLKRLAISLIIVFFLLVLTSAFSTNSNALTYNVVKNKNIIGVIKISKTTSGDYVTYDLSSRIKAKFVLNFNIQGKEQSIYKNDTLVFSSVYRKLNSKVKVDHNITYEERHYKLNKKGDQENLNLEAIKRNLITLYFNEPKGLKRVYCDNQNEMVNIKCIGQGIYKVDFSNGKHNIFHYKNGRCVKIEANSKMFNVTLIPA